MQAFLLSVASSSLLVISLSGCGSAPSPRIGSYLVVGDWGHDKTIHGNCITDLCQNTVSQKMNETMAELGDVKFIVNVGDSFYPQGVANNTDEQWDTKWRDRYSQLLRSVPWYSVYGNHDYHQDPGVCSDVVAHGAQINGDINDLNTFYMPSYNWYLEHPELDLEVVGLDLNNYMNMWNNDTSASQHSYTDCQYTACEESCYSRIKNRSVEAFDLFKTRSAATSAKNMLVFSHYPTDYWWDTSPDDPSHDFLAGLRDSSRYHLAYFGGHRHSTDKSSTTSIDPNDSWLSGGGGGWSCDTTTQGFVVGEIFANGTMTTSAVLVPPGQCCDMMKLYAEPEEVFA